jgi:hypothetical protein
LPLLTELARLVAVEIADERFFGQKHHDRNTYANGCHGPLCRKAERDRAREKYAANNPGHKPRQRKPEDIVRDAYLNQVVEILRAQPLLEGVS